MAAAAFVSWGLYGPFTEYILTSPDHKSQATLTLSALVGAFLVGIEGSKIFYGREPEARADGSIIVESPPADIPIPACFHLADYNDLLALAVKGNAKKIARIRSGFEDGLCGRRAPTDSWGDIRPIRPDPAFLELPVAERAAGGRVVLDVEYRGVGLEEHELDTIRHVSELDAGSVDTGWRF
jgi:hypothetical protein